MLALGSSLDLGDPPVTTLPYPAVLQRLTGWQVVANSGVSGVSSADARACRCWSSAGPALVIVGIGGSDFLRQMGAAGARDNIRAICRARFTAAGAQVMLVAVPFWDLQPALSRLTDHRSTPSWPAELRLLPLCTRGGWAEVLGDRLHTTGARASIVRATKFAGDWRSSFAQGWKLTA